MFFGNNHELKEKDEQISTLQLAIKELNKEKDHNLNLKKEEIHTLNKKLALKMKELEDKEKELEKRTKELEDSRNSLELITSNDMLTGVYNKRYFYDVAESIISLAKREKHSLSLAILEINQLNKIREREGDKTGDEILQTFVHKISLRESDLFVRFAEQRFVILFPHTNIEQAKIISEKIRKDIESYTLFKSIDLTASICITEYKISEDNINTALQRVESLLAETQKNSVNTI